MKNCAILIQTCDKYEKFWNGFFNFFKKNWDSNIESSIYFSNENKEINLPKNIKQIKTGTGTFVQNLKKTLNQIEQDEIFFILEDFWPIAPMNKKLFSELYDFFKNHNLDAFQVGPYTPYYKLNKTKYEINNQYVWKIQKDSDWLFNLQARFWKKDILDKCLKEPGLSESKVNSAITVEIASDVLAKKYNLNAAFYHYFWYPIGGVSYRGEFTEIGNQMHNIVAIDELAKNLAD